MLCRGASFVPFAACRVVRAFKRGLRVRRVFGRLCRYSAFTARLARFAGVYAIQGGRGLFCCQFIRRGLPRVLSAFPGPGRGYSSRMPSGRRVQCWIGPLCRVRQSRIGFPRRLWEIVSYLTVTIVPAVAVCQF